MLINLSVGYFRVVYRYNDVLIKVSFRSFLVVYRYNDVLIKASLPHIHNNSTTIDEVEKDKSRKLIMYTYTVTNYSTSVQNTD